MQFPKLNLNGTSQRHLLDLNCQARLSLEDALTRLQEAAPHGRDYFGNDLDIAKKEHLIRVLKIQCVIAELDSIIDSIDGV
jgi:hypothetical protein